MTIRVDIDLWKQFDRASERAGQTPEEVVLDFMRDYAARNPFGSASSGLGFDFGDGAGSAQTLDLFGQVSDPIDDQFDLEDYLGGHGTNLLQRPRTK